MCQMILKSDNERHSYGPDKLIPPASQPASQPARIRQSNNQFFPSENLVKNNLVGLNRNFAEIDNRGEVDLRLEDVFSTKKMAKLLRPYIQKEVKDAQNRNELLVPLQEYIIKEIHAYFVETTNATIETDTKDKKTTNKTIKTNIKDKKKSERRQGKSGSSPQTFQLDNPTENDVRKIYTILRNHGTRVEHMSVELEKNIKDLNTKIDKIEDRLDKGIHTIVEQFLHKKLGGIQNNLTVLADLFHDLEYKTRTVRNEHIEYIIDEKVQSMKSDIMAKLLHESSPIRSELHHKLEEVKRTQRVICENHTEEIQNIHEKLVTMLDQIQEINGSLFSQMTSTELTKVYNDTADFVRTIKDSWIMVNDNFERSKDMYDRLENLNRLYADVETSVREASEEEKQSSGAITDIKAQLEVLKEKITAIEFNDRNAFNFTHSDKRNGCKNGRHYVRLLNVYLTPKYVGVTLCSENRYKIFLGENLTDTFLDIGDNYGLGEDHCEFVGAKTSSRFSTVMQPYMYYSLEGFIRSHWGEQPQKKTLTVFKSPPFYYECGVTIP
ncbi:uncharacterized protein LOC127865188 [Dreissena polymorpha]|uniref:uncharacterized protein LOC127865188 n=1 Tax=Dreissena polymorpha TaxID=45954 RepID=UPI002264FC41|nr:uncharacterized protein LOC127865188 [Dreissena polymorpha]